MKYFSSRRIAVVPNPINIEKVESVSEKEREKVIISAGRLSSVKQFEKLIEIFNEISADHPDWKLKIFGDGSQRKKLEDKIASYSLQDRVLLPGNTNNIYDEMQKASIFALTSKTEGFSMVLLEAMINGLPVISYDSPNGPRNIIKDNEDGHLVPLNDKQKFKKRLRHLIENRDLRRKMSERGRENVLRFKVNEVMKIWDKLFIDLGLEAKGDERMIKGKFSKN
jgi:glycosyltransferase involved in cell wall biosynthesis